MTQKSRSYTQNNKVNKSRIKMRLQKINFILDLISFFDQLCINRRSQKV